MPKTYETILSEVYQRLTHWWESIKPFGLLREHLPHYAKPYATAIYWASVLSTNEVSEAHQAIVRRALEREGVKDPTPEEIAPWASELPALLRAMLPGLRLEEISAQELYEPKSVEGLFFLDARAALTMEKRGAVALAKLLRTEGAKRWESYQEGLEFASPLGRAMLTPAVWWLFANEKLAEDGLPPFTFAIFAARALLQEQREKLRVESPTEDAKKIPTRAPGTTSFIPALPTKITLVQKLAEPKKKKPSIWDADEDAKTLLRPITHLRALLDPRGLTSDQIVELLPNAFTELRADSVREVGVAYDKLFTRTTPAKEAEHSLPLGLGYCVALGHFGHASQGQTPRPYHHLIAEGVLQQEEEREGEEHERDALARALQDALRAAYRDIRLEEQEPNTIHAPPSERGMLLYDVRAARFYERLGKEGEKIARALRQKSRDLWADHQLAKPYATQALWSSCWASPKGELGPFLFAWVLGQTLWRDQIKAYLKRSHKNPPGIAKVCLERVQGSHLKRWSDDVERDGDHHLVLKDGKNKMTVQVPGLSAREMSALIDAMGSLGNLTWHRVLRHVIQKAHQQTLDGKEEPYSLRFEGGVSGLAEACGETSDQGKMRIVEVLRAGQWLRLTWPGGEAGGLWSYVWDENTTAGKHALLRIDLAPVLRPYFGLKHLPDDPWIVPIVPLPDFVSAPRTHAGQAAFQNRLMVELLEKRAELVKRGGALLLPATIDRLIRESGLTVETGRKVFEHWQKGPKAFLEKTGPDTYQLADNDTYGQARAFYQTAGARTIEGREKGLKSHQPKLKPTRKKGTKTSKTSTKPNKR